MTRAAAAVAVQAAVAALAGGRLVVVMDDPDREDEGDLIGCAESVTPVQMAFLVRHTTGIVCAPLTPERAADLRLPQMVPPDNNSDAHRTAFTVSVDHVSTGTGVSVLTGRRRSERWRILRRRQLSSAGPATCSRCGLGRGGADPCRAHGGGCGPDETSWLQRCGCHRGDRR